MADDREVPSFPEEAMVDKSVSLGDEVIVQLVRVAAVEAVIV